MARPDAVRFPSSGMGVQVVIDLAVLKAMAAAGASADMIIAAIEAHLKVECERKAEAAERQRKSRASRVTSCDKGGLSQDVTECHTANPSSLKERKVSPIPPLKKENTPSSPGTPSLPQKSTSTINLASAEAYAFERGAIKLNQKDFNQWKRAFPNLALEAELHSLAPWAAKQTSWFDAVSGALAKKQRQALLEIERVKAEAAANGHDLFDRNYIDPRL